MSDEVHYMKHETPDPKEPRLFLGPGYLKVTERNTYGLFRDLFSEHVDPKTLEKERVKLREVGPIGIFREAEGDELVEMRTVHPVTGKELKLKCISREM